MSKNERPEELEAGALMGGLLAEQEATVPELKINPCELWLATMRRIGALRYPTIAQERIAVKNVRNFFPTIKQLILDFDLVGLRALAWKIEENCKKIAEPEREPDFWDDYRSCVQDFYKASWSAAEADALRYVVVVNNRFPKDRIYEITPSSVKIGDRIVTRTQVRAELKARDWSNVQLAQFERMEQDRLRVDELNAEAIKQGKAEPAAFMA
jgi:hypothetical protein